MSPKQPSLAQGCVKLGVAYAARYSLPSLLAALPLILVFALATAVENTNLLAVATARIHGGFFAKVAVDYLLEAAEAGLAVLIVVMTIRRVMRGAGEGNSLAGEIANSIKVPLIPAAARASWVVLGLLGALYVLLHVSGAIIAEGGPRNILLIPIFLVIMPLTTGGPFGLLVVLLGIAALVILLGLTGLYAVRNTLLHSGAEAAAELPVFRPVLDRPFGMIRLVLNLTWLYGVPFILIYKWVPSLIFPAMKLPSFSDVQAATSSGAGALQPETLIAFARGFYDGGIIAFGLILAALAALIIWNKAAEIALDRTRPDTVETVVRTRPWHDPKTPLETVLEPRATFGRRGR